MATKARDYTQDDHETLPDEQIVYDDPNPDERPYVEGDVFRNVRMTPELMDTLFTRDNDGYAIAVRWGDPDADGFYTPTITTDYTDRLTAEDLHDASHPYAEERSAGGEG